MTIAVLYFKSLNRPFLVLGVERQLFYGLIALCLPIAISGRLMFSMDVLSFLLFLVFYTLGVLVTRIDPQVLAIAKRHLRFHPYYAPVPHIGASIPKLLPSVPIYQGQRGFV